MRYSIRQVEQILGVSQSTIRRMEDRGLVDVHRDPENNYRWYSGADIARLAIHLGTLHQNIQTPEIQEMQLRDISEQKRGITARIARFDEEIGRLELQKECWEMHLHLLEMMDNISDSKTGSILEAAPALAVFNLDMENAEDIKNAYFYSIFRQERKDTVLFRLCNLFEKTELEKSGKYQPAFYCPAEMLGRKDLQISGPAQIIPARQYMVSVVDNASLIDEELPESAERIKTAVGQEVRRLLALYGEKCGGEIIAITVGFTDLNARSLLLVPIKEA